MTRPTYYDTEDCAIGGRDFEPAAGASALGAWGFNNPMTLWLLKKAPELLALTPQQLGRRESPPLCRSCLHPMVFRLEGWTCYRHQRVVDGEVTGAPIRVPHKLPIPEAPTESVLDRLAEPLDVVYRRGSWRVVNMETGAGL